MAGSLEPVRTALTSALDKALHLNQGLVDAYLARARRSRPDAAPAEIVASLERQYLAAVTTLGIGAEVTAAMPGTGTAVGLAVNLAEVVTLLGNGASSFVQKAAGRTGPYWGRNLAKAIPMTTIDAVNDVLGPRFVTKFGTKQGIRVLGRELPFGIGAAIGGGGNALLGRATVTAARRAFGPAPDFFPLPAPG
jgi:hypothetical protein